MAQDTIVGTDTVKDALLTKTNDDVTELFAAIAALVAGSGVLVSSNDDTIGYLNGKLVAGYNLTFTEGDDGSDETLTIAVTSGVPTAGTNVKLTAGTGTTTFSSVGMDVLTKTADYTITTADLGKTIRINSASDLTATLPSVGTTQDGYKVKVCKLGAGKVTIDPADSDTIADSGATMYNDTATETWAWLILEYVHATTNWNISGLGTWVSTS